MRRKTERANKLLVELEDRVNLEGGPEVQGFGEDRSAAIGRGPFRQSAILVPETGIPTVLMRTGRYELSCYVYAG